MSGLSQKGLFAGPALDGTRFHAVGTVAHAAGGDGLEDHCVKRLMRVRGQGLDGGEGVERLKGPFER